MIDPRRLSRLERLVAKLPEDIRWLMEVFVDAMISSDPLMSNAKWDRLIMEMEKVVEKFGEKNV